MQKYDGWVHAAWTEIGEPNLAERNLAKLERNRHLVLQRNKEINKAYADMFLKNPDVYLWSGMASLASSKVGHTMSLVLKIWSIQQTVNQIACGIFPWCADLWEWIQNKIIGAMGLPNAEEMWVMLRKGNYMIFEDIYCKIYGKVK